MECKACADAMQDPSSGLYHGNCIECSARALSKSPGFFASTLEGRFRNDYRAALKQYAGSDPGDIQEMHKRVKAWAERCK